MIFIDFHSFSLIINWFFMEFHRFSLMFIDFFEFHWFSTRNPGPPRLGWKPGLNSSFEGMRRRIPSGAGYLQKTSRIPSVGRRIPSVFSRIPSVFSRIPSDFSRIPSELYQKRRAGYHQFHFFESCVGWVQTDGMRRRRIPSVRQAWVIAQTSFSQGRRTSRRK